MENGRLTIASPQQDAGFRQAVAELSAASIPAVSILVVDAVSRAEPDERVLCELFSLTPAEARMAGKLALGRSLEEIAAESKISFETQISSHTLFG